MSAFEDWLMGLTWTQFWLLITGAFAFPSLLLLVSDHFASRRERRRVSEVIDAPADESISWREDAVARELEAIKAIFARVNCPWCLIRQGECQCSPKCEDPACPAEDTGVIQLTPWELQVLRNLETQFRR